MKKITLLLVLHLTACLLLITACKKSSAPVTIPLLPSITGIAPATGPAGTMVVISGTNFSSTTTDNTVQFNGVNASVSAASATSLTVAAPATGTTGKVTVTTAGGTATGPVFTYVVVPPAPTITSINPTSGTAGTAITITGTNFNATAANNTVKFNGVAAVVTSASTTSIVATAPASGTTGNITVTTSGGTSNGVLFTYITGAAVYTCGSVTNLNPGFGYWKNSAFTNISSCTYAYCIAGAGSDIYVAGPANTNTPTYWKNGTSVQLSAQTGNISAIAISGTDIYCGGANNNANTIWKNGTVVSTMASVSVATMASGNHALFVAGTDVYAAGNQYGPGAAYFQAIYWKNGTVVPLTAGTSSNAKATAVYVSGTDVYVAGTEEVKSGIGIINLAPRLWKNGVSVTLTTPANNLFNNVSSVLVAGSDVYVGGQYNGAGAVWKNGAMINTSAYAVAEQVTSLFLYNNTDLYASGSAASSGMNGYWKNASFVEMDPGCNTTGPACAATLANNVSGIIVK